MKLIKVGAAALNQTPLDWDGNKANILGAIGEARTAGVSVLCLPELCICGYGCEDAFHSPGLRRTARAVLAEILPATAGLAVAMGLPVMHGNALFSTACLAVDGQIRGFVAKQFLAGQGLHYEPRWFKAWPAGRRDEVTYGRTSYPIGDIHFDLGGVKVGFEICQDAWAARRPGGRLAAAGADVILNPSASHFAFAKHEVRKRFVLEGSRAFGVTYVYSNLLGNEAGRAIYDGGALIATAGRLAAAGPRLTYDRAVLTTAVVDIDITRAARACSAAEPSGGADEACIRVGFDYPARQPERAAADLPAWERGPDVKEEEFTRAVALGLFDYMRKSRCRGFVVSLSGGADSSAVACLAALMVRLACEHRPVADVAERLCPGGRPPRDERDLVNRLLTCVYQRTENSSDTTRNAAGGLARALNAEFIELDVDPLCKGYVSMIADAIGRPLAWETDDIALQNIQARVRAPGVWMLANLANKLLLATSNRSEAAVGYATMDGDTCGGLGPIAGIDKAFLRRWLRWLETTGPAGIGPIPALAAVNRQAPTAELRPPSAEQTDEDDLMPYDLLDAVENAAIGQKKTPAEVLPQMQSDFPQYGREQLVTWIERFFVLWSRNQWKRERYAPSFHVDDKNLDPKTWCRFPILSGGFSRELAELRDQSKPLK